MSNSSKIMVKLIRNIEYHPFIDREGYFEKSLPIPPHLTADKFWFEKLLPHERMFYQQTLNSTRRFARFKPFKNSIPENSLDFILDAKYEHERDLFATKMDIVLQNETIGKQQSFRRLRNTRDISPEKFIAIGHPLQIGGCKEKLSPNSVKLMCSGQHTPLTNPGYSRQKGDGNFFNY